jgi:GrpB-like predicted nucleotidyltransferase (UPF0157 family)
VLDVDEPVELAAPDPAWAAAFEAEAARLAPALGGAPLEHIGSTAVAGLAAKPIVDIMVGVDDVGDVRSLVDRLAELGYVDCGGEPGRRYLRRRGAQGFNVQIVDRGGELWAANLEFRDHLRADASAREAYETAKARAAEAAPFLLAYSEAKRPAIEALLRQARGS